MNYTDPRHITLVLSDLELYEIEGNARLANATTADLQELASKWHKVLRNTDRSINELGQSNFHVTKNRVSDLLAHHATKTSPTLTADTIRFFAHEAYELRRLFSEEIKSKGLLVLSEEERVLYECTSPPFGADVFNQFPSASHHLVEASKCRALERYTACVFHLMNAMGIALDGLARQLGVGTTTEWFVWNRVVRDIEGTIKMLSNSATTQSEKEKLQFYQRAAQHFWVLKDAHRNPVMHGREQVDQQQAEQIWHAAESFMQHLARGK